jgi:hypothetical protein
MISTDGISLSHDYLIKQGVTSTAKTAQGLKVKHFQYVQAELSLLVPHTVCFPIDYILFCRQ